MPFDPRSYGEEIAAILGLDGNGERLMPIAMGRCSSEEARERMRNRSVQELFPQSRSPEAALSGLYLYFSCLDDAHEVAQGIPTPDGSYWHGIMHRQEPDAGNSEYWFRRVGLHPVFPELRRAAAVILAAHREVGMTLSKTWDPFAFIHLCEKARRSPGSELEEVALQIQRAEWQLLFDYCARYTA